MISDFLLKNIDNFFNQKLSLKDPKPLFNQKVLKRDLSTVIKSKRDISQTRQESAQQNEQSITKSRLKLQLEQNKESIVEEIVKRTSMIKSKSSNKINYKPMEQHYQEERQQPLRDHYQHRNNYRDISPKKQQTNLEREVSRKNLMNKYKQNVETDYTNPYMPSKDHATRQKQCRLPIRGYGKYQF